MSDTLIVAISQSGTTTDTNRTVDLARTRGAHVVAVVNRRNSDLAAKAHGVLYTSDGRDVEMSVASTKAFYAQVAAGWLLAGALAQAASDGQASAVAGAHRPGAAAPCATLPEAMRQVLARREEIGRIAAVRRPRPGATGRWSAADRTAWRPPRCASSCPSCATGPSPATPPRTRSTSTCPASRSSWCARPGCAVPTPTTWPRRSPSTGPTRPRRSWSPADGEADRFRAAALDVVTVPATDPDLAFVLSAMVGHLFGYEAALSIDAQARPLREARAAIEAAVSAGP